MFEIGLTLFLLGSPPVDVADGSNAEKLQEVENAHQTQAVTPPEPATETDSNLETEKKTPLPEALSPGDPSGASAEEDVREENPAEGNPSKERSADEKNPILDLVVDKTVERVGPDRLDGHRPRSDAPPSLRKGAGMPTWIVIGAQWLAGCSLIVLCYTPALLFGGLLWGPWIVGDLVALVGNALGTKQATKWTPSIATAICGIPSAALFLAPAAIVAGLTFQEQQRSGTPLVSNWAIVGLLAFPAALLVGAITSAAATAGYYAEIQLWDWLAAYQKREAAPPTEASPATGQPPEARKHDAWGSHDAIAMLY